MDMSTTMTVRVETTPFDGQKPGTSGLRKRVSEFQQPHYLPGNRRRRTLLQPRGDPAHPAMAAANGVERVMVAQGGLLSTPAASCVIRKYKLPRAASSCPPATTPAGPKGDFGIKFNIANGGPARSR
jgi:phosphoglucomutase